MDAADGGGGRGSGAGRYAQRGGLCRLAEAVACAGRASRPREEVAWSRRYLRCRRLRHARVIPGGEYGCDRSIGLAGSAQGRMIRTKRDPGGLPTPDPAPLGNRNLGGIRCRD